MAETDGLRRWQAEALKAWTHTNFRGIAEVATGGGKTRFALAAFERWREHEPTGRALIIVPSAALLDQWSVAVSLHHDIVGNQIALWPGGRESDRLVTIMIVNTARKAARTFMAASSTPILVIADECHRYATDTNQSAIDLDQRYALGLTATAERDYDDGLDDILVPSLGPVFFRYDLAQAALDGVVTPFCLVNVEVSLTNEEAAEYSALSRRIAVATARDDQEKLKWILLKRARLVKSARMRLPTAIALMEKLRGRRTLVFHEDTRSAEVLAEMLRRRGHSAATYHSLVGPALRRDNLRQFRTGLVDVLVSCRALDEGVDIPEAEAAVIVASSASRRQRVQRLGRVLRRADEKDMARVYTLYATTAERERLLSEQAVIGDLAEVAWRTAELRDNA
jgi:superfamily II DNA or RNA helicase